MLVQDSEKTKNSSRCKTFYQCYNSELISPIYHYLATSTLIKEVISNHVHELVDKEIKSLNMSLLDAGKEELNPSEAIFEKFRLLDNHFSSDDGKDEDSKCYQFLAKKFLDAIEGVGAEIEMENYDPLALRESIKKVIDNENIRNRGFNTANNKLTSILDTSKMGYQYIENYKNARECVIREYEDQTESRLPDERYAIRMVYLDHEQIESARKAYNLQLRELENNVDELYQICHKLYLRDRDQKGSEDWETLSQRYLSKLANSKYDDDDEDDDESGDEKLWNEVLLATPRDTEVLKYNPTFEIVKESMDKKFKLINQLIQKVFGYHITEVRSALEKRIKFIYDSYSEFKALINPYQLQPGLLLDIDITSIKRKRTTMLGMANVLNEFLYSLSKGFSDSAFASFSRRRSTQRDDIDRDFTTTADGD